MTVISAQLEASFSNPTATIPQIVLLTPLHPWTWTPTQTHKLPWQTNTFRRATPFQSIHIFVSEVRHAQQSRVLRHSLQSHPALPRLPVEGRTSKGGRENERGHFSLGPGVKLTRGLRVLRTSHGSLICWTAEWQSSSAGQIGERQGGPEMETETEEDIVKLKWYDIGRHSRQIKPGNATFMQVTSNIPFNLFLTTEESLWNIDGKDEPWSVSLKPCPSN